MLGIPLFYICCLAIGIVNIGVGHAVLVFHKRPRGYNKLNQS